MSLVVVGFFTFLIHLTEALAYCMRLAGLRTRQIAIALSFVTSTLLISRLSNMFQAPLLGQMVDQTVQMGTTAALDQLHLEFRVLIFCGFLGSVVGAFLTPSMVFYFQKAIKIFLVNGSLSRTAAQVFKPRVLKAIVTHFRLPSLQALKTISLGSIPRGFLVLNVVVTSVYTIGVLCALAAGAMLPELMATAIQLSGIVNGLATILFTVFVDPAGARITDQAINGLRPENDVRSVVFFLLAGRILGTAILAQLLFGPFTLYIAWVTQVIAHVF